MVYTMLKKCYKCYKVYEALWDMGLSVTLRIEKSVTQVLRKVLQYNKKPVTTGNSYKQSKKR